MAYQSWYHFRRSIKFVAVTSPMNPSSSSFTHTWQKENLPTSYNLQNRFCFDPMLATTASHWLKMSKNVSSVIKLQFKFFLKKVWIFQLRYQFQISWWAFFWHFQPKCFPVLSRASSRIKGKQAKNSSEFSMDFRFSWFDSYDLGLGLWTGTLTRACQLKTYSYAGCFYFKILTIIPEPEWRNEENIYLTSNIPKNILLHKWIQFRLNPLLLLRLRQLVRSRSLFFILAREETRGQGSDPDPEHSPPFPAHSQTLARSRPPVFSYSLYEWNFLKAETMA